MGMNSRSPLKVGVIGAGIVGLSSALHLQRLGASVTLIDRNEPGSSDATSYGNAGILARCSVVPVPTPHILKKAPSMLFGQDGPLFMKWSYFPKLLPFLIPYLKNSKRETVEYIAEHLTPLLDDSVDQHLALAKGTGAEKWIRPCEYMFLYSDRAAFEGDAFGWGLRQQHGFEWYLLEGDDIQQLNPSLSTAYKCAVVMKDHGMITSPGHYIEDLFKAFTRDGGQFERANVRDIERDGEMARLKTEGADLDFDQVVVACGAHSHFLAQKHGATVRLEAERGYHLELIGANRDLTIPVMDAARKFVASPMDGRLRFAGVVEFGGLKAPASKGPTDLLMRGAKAMLPGLEFETKRTWLGHRPGTTDSLPIIGPAPNGDPVHFAYGHHHVGLTAGPKTGRIIAHHVMKTQPNESIDAYRCDRAG